MTKGFTTLAKCFTPWLPVTDFATLAKLFDRRILRVK